jgi:hypothetical protein
LAGCTRRLPRHDGVAEASNPKAITQANWSEEDTLLKPFGRLFEVLGHTEAEEVQDGEGTLRIGFATDRVFFKRLSLFLRFGAA